MATTSKFSRAFAPAPAHATPTLRSISASTEILRSSWPPTIAIPTAILPSISQRHVAWLRFRRASFPLAGQVHCISTTSVPLNFRFALYPHRIDAKRGDHFLHADLSLLIGPPK